MDADLYLRLYRQQERLLEQRLDHRRAVQERSGGRVAAVASTTSARRAWAVAGRVLAWRIAAPVTRTDRSAGRAAAPAVCCTA